MNMSVFGKAFLDRETKAILEALEGMTAVFGRLLFFEDVRKQAEKVILGNKTKIREIMLANNISPKRAAYTWVNNVAGDMLESGQYHVYRGVLNQMGNDLLNIFDETTDELCRMGEFDEAFAAQQKGMIMQSIASVG